METTARPAQSWVMFRRFPAPPPASPSVDRGTGGDRLLLVFFAATVIMVVAVVLVGAVVQWWVLVPVMLVDLAVTFVVIAALVQLLGHDG